VSPIPTLRVYLQSRLGIFGGFLGLHRCLGGLAHRKFSTLLQAAITCARTRRRFTPCQQLPPGTPGKAVPRKTEHAWPYVMERTKKVIHSYSFLVSKVIPNVVFRAGSASFSSGKRKWYPKRDSKLHTPSRLQRFPCQGALVKSSRDFILIPSKQNPWKTLGNTDDFNHLSCPLINCIRVLTSALCHPWIEGLRGPVSQCF